MKRIRLLSISLLVMGLSLTLAACATLFQWTPVRDGADLDTDHVVRYEGIEIRVQKFGVYNDDGAPTAEIRTRNGSPKPVAFGIDGFRLDIGGQLVPAVLNQEGEFPSIYLEPGESYNTRLTFAPVALATTEAPKTQALPDVLHLHLAPLVIDGEYHELPVLSYRNPRS